MGLISKKLGKKSKNKVRAASVVLAAGFTFLPFLGGCKDKEQQADLPTASTEQVVDSSAYEELEKTIEDLKNQLAETNGKVDMLSSMYGELYTKVIDLLAKYEELLAKVNANAEDIEGLKAEITALFAEVNEIKTKIENETGAEIDNASIKELDEKLCKLIILSSVQDIRSRYNRIDAWQYKDGENTDYACIYTDNSGNFACAETHSGISFAYEDSISFVNENGAEHIQLEDGISVSVVPFAHNLENYNISSQDGKIVMESKVEGRSFEIEVDSNMQVTSFNTYSNDGQLVYEYEYSLGYDYWFESEVELTRENIPMYDAYKDVKTAFTTSYTGESYLKVYGEGVSLDDTTMQATMMLSKNAGAGYASTLFDDKDGESWVYQKGSKSEAVDVYSDGKIDEYGAYLFDKNTDNATTFYLNSLWENIKGSAKGFKSITYNEEKGVYILSFDFGLSFEITIDEIGNISKVYQNAELVEGSDLKSACYEFSVCTKEEFVEFFKQAKDKVLEYKAQNEKVNEDDLDV